MRDLSNRYSAPVIGGQKIDVEKFDGKINFGMWRREVMDALIQIDLDEVKYLVKDEECAVTLWRTWGEKYLVKSPKNRLHAMSQVYGFRMKPRVSMHDHVSRFEKLLADLKNLDEDIKDEVKAIILLHSLPEEYSHFVTTLIYGKTLVSKDWAMEKQKKRGGKNSRSKSRSRNIARDECAFCHEKGHWRKDCPKAQKRDGKKPAAANMARKDDGSHHSLSITPAAYVASSSEWILDTRATYHLCPIKEWFTNFRNLESGAVVMGNDQPYRTMGIGTIRLKIFDGMVRELKEVRFVLTLKKNLIFVGALEAKGYKVTIEDGIMKFTHGAMVILQGVRRHNLYYLKGGKKTRVKFSTANHDTREILEYVHSDVWGPTKTASIGGSHYFVTFIDDFSRRVWVYTMRGKDEVLEIFVKWKKLVETQTGRKIKVVRYDNGGEYTSDPFLQVCQNEGIKRHFTVRHTSQQNSVAERMNRTLLEKVRCMLSNTGLDKKFWAEAVSYASHLVNRLPSAAIGGKTPMEMWSGKYAQDYDSLRVFGCPAYYHVKDGKLDPRVRKAIFMGFKSRVKGFKLWDLEDKKFVCTGDVTFDEASMMKASSSQQVENKTKEVLQRVELDATPYVPVSSTSKKSSTIEVTPRVEEEVVFSDVPQNEETIDDVDNDDFIATRRPRREIKKPRWLTKDMVVAYALPVIDDDFPNTFEYELELAQLDVKTAFLHGDLEEEIYMIQPCGFRVTGKENHVCRLIKSLYGLKQSPRRLPDEAFIYLLLYVDGMLIALKNRDEIERLKKQLASEFEMKDLGDAQRILGMEIRRDKKNGSVWLTQKFYLKKVLERFGMDDKTKSICTPLAPHFKLSSYSCPRSQEECDYMAHVPYASAVGSLIDLDKRRSTMGYIFTLGGGLVSWRSILQSTIALSTTEAEYMAATEAVKEAIWLKGLLGDLGVI
ncbi:Integrase catalytic domain-containing protein [Citrus sinensis]|nr:Integrase catalytic domain-containing protein [Citrus sinensis]